MRFAKLGFAVVLTACSAPSAPARQAEERSPRPPPASSTAAAAPVVERLTADTPRTTFLGNSFVAPAGWSIVVRGTATLLEAPEGDSHIALVDVRAKDADAAVAAAWAAVRPGPPWPLASAIPLADKDGWSDRRQYLYQTSPDERREVSATARRAGESWTVSIHDVAEATGEKRAAQVDQIYGRL